ncbi:MAG: type II toxin-antitoxin system VapB family antitoxin [Thermoleophilia bacterium]|nr:type II toxin-antitoxin system VapB family antitoxin [Thermoleophilia bacterium]
MNIKNDHTEALAREVAAHSGESLTTAITVALEERRDRQLRAADREQLLTDLASISADLRRRIGPDPLPDHGELLYDELGLPK